MSEIRTGPGHAYRLVPGVSPIESPVVQIWVAPPGKEGRPLATIDAADIAVAALIAMGAPPLAVSKALLASEQHAPLGAALFVAAKRLGVSA